MIQTLLLRRNAAVLLAVAFAVAVALTALDITPASSQSPWLRAFKVESSADLMDPWSGIWDDARQTEVALSSQSLTNPLGGGQVSTVQARALHDGEKLYVMLQWKDKTLDDLVNEQTLFTDGAGIQMPSDPSVRIPSFCMGDAQAGVNIWHWKASWQRDIEQGFASADVTSDGYLRSEPEFQPARALGNLLSQTEHASPVENLVAAGFGSLTSAERQDIDGYGRWDDGKWRVVFARDMEQPAGYPSLDTGNSDIAFAVWDGSSGNRDGMKSVSQFIQLHILSAAPEGGDGDFPWWGWGLAVAILLTGISALVIAYVSASGPRKV
jgi:complex iron-sulfur molybdoenzyme family reductase subunit gamma